MAVGDTRDRVDATRPSTKVFIAFAAPDAEWAKGFLIPATGLAPDAITTQDDFQPGADVVSEYEQAILESRHVVLVLSEAFLRDRWSAFAEVLATHAGVAGLAERIVPVVRSPMKVPLRLDWRVRLDFSREEDWPGQASRLRQLFSSAPPVAEVLPSPYPGLAEFGPDRALYFFGRRGEIEDLQLRVRRHSLVVVVGVSGAGKSSLIGAGLLPALRHDGNLNIRVIESMATPFDDLAMALDLPVADLTAQKAADAAKLLALDGGTRLILIVDPLEPVFTLAPRDARRWLSILQALRQSPRCTLLLVVRADMYGQLIASPLWPLRPGEQFDLAPLTDDHVREAIVRPARVTGVYVEPVLVERLIQESGQLRSGHSLPLLQQTLELLWERRTHRFLSLRSYEDLGVPGRRGLAFAVSTHADAVIGQLPHGGADVARRILVRLVEVVDLADEGEHEEMAPMATRYLRRRARVTDLRVMGEDERLFDAVLNDLARGRLVALSGAPTTQEPLAQLTHDTVVDHWPLLAGWISEDREQETRRRRLEADATTWLRQGRSSDSTYRGSLLTDALRWARSHPELVSGVVHGFLAAGRRRRNTVQVAVGLATAVMLATVSMLAWLVALPRIQDHRLREQARDLGGTVSLPAGVAMIGTARRPTSVDAMRVDLHEVSLREYRLCVQARACARPDEVSGPARFADGPADLPVVQVTAFDANAFCRWVGGRLPTQVEWERMARGPSGRTYPWGEQRPTPQQVNAGFEEEETSARPVEDPALAAGRTPEGIWNLIGNVAEWTSTRATAKADGYPLQLLGPWDGKRVSDQLAVMGGGFMLEPLTGYQGWVFGAANHDEMTGFRCVFPAN